VLSQSISVAMHHEWSFGQIKLADCGEQGCMPAIV
jgi:hypothetical protein